ncbi:MAG: cytochrome c3 family protein [Acidobacteriia bacterium]|nr:cytochrome c3 family protein [Terriglobia bacterium]
MRRERIVRVARLAAAALGAALLLAALPLRAQQSTATAGAEKQVPDNPAAHMPPAQPLPYSHQTHLALGLECSMCHTNPEPGNLMTFPATSVCMGCHTTVATNKPSIQKLATFAKSGQPIPWVRVYAVTKGVNWTHRKHLDAGVKCETCHGQVADMATMSQTTSVTSMGVCISCHKLNNAPTVCQTCHSWPAN